MCDGDLVVYYDIWSLWRVPLIIFNFWLFIQRSDVGYSYNTFVYFKGLIVGTFGQLLNLLTGEYGGLQPSDINIW